MLKKYWQKISHLGVTAKMSLSEQKKVILLNQLSVILFFVFSILNVSIHLFYVNLPLFSLLSAFPILAAPILNYFNKTRLSAIIISVLTPIVTLFMATDAKLAIINNVPIFGYIFPRVMLISFIVLPFIFIDKKQKLSLIFTTLFNFCFVFVFDPYHKFIGVDFFQVKLLLDSYYMTNYFIVFPMLTILLALIFLTNINVKYEDKVLQLVNELEKKNKNITDSINYASRIQQALLPSKNAFEENLPNHFILYKPKNIVSGDFYYLKKTENKLIIAVADCTGHGVPGAFVSILGIAFLNEIVAKNEIKTAAHILEQLRILIKSSLQQTETKKATGDGMDIALCLVDTETNILQYAGAYNPLYIVKPSKTLQEIKATKAPIGIHIIEKKFNNYEIDVQKGDKYYIFSDGYADQFGEEKNIKFMSRNFKNLIAEISDKSFINQKEILDKTIEDWRGSKEQNDDILVVGFEIF